MIRWLMWIAGGLVLGGIVHLTTIMVLPRTATKDAYARLAPLAPLNGFAVLPAPTPQASSVPFMDPAFATAVCRYYLGKGPVKLKGEVLEFAFAKQKENPDLDPGRLAALIQERYSIPIHRTTVLRGMKKKRRSPRKGSASNIRGEQRPSAGDL